MVIFLPIFLTIAGLFFIFEASSIRSYGETGDLFRYVKLQTVWLSIGIVFMIFFSWFDYKKLYYISVMAIIVSMIFLVFVLIPGIGKQIGGARRWIDFGFFSLQPTEFSKLSVILYLSAWFTHKERKRFFSFVVLLSLLMFLVMMQPDMGTAIIIFLISITLYFLAGIELWYLAVFLPLCAVAGYILVHISPYRFKRIMAFFDPTLDPLGITYHITQIMVSLSNGGLLGHGFGASKQKYLFLPEAHTDSIFAIIGEEVGFVGATMLIIGFIVFLYLLYRVHMNTSDRFGKLLSGGILAFFGFQMVTNLSAMVNLIPLTGVPLPFISYGGSNLLTSFILVGMAINIARQGKQAT